MDRLCLVGAATPLPSLPASRVGPRSSGAGIWVSVAPLRTSSGSPSVLPSGRGGEGSGGLTGGGESLSSGEREETGGGVGSVGGLGGSDDSSS